MNNSLSTRENEPGRASPAVNANGWRGTNGLILLALCATGVLLVFYAAVDPSSYNIFPRCVFHQITGLNCPGCGGQRAIHHLLRGDVSGALHLNALLVMLVPVGLWGLFRWSLMQFFRRKVPTPFAHARWVWALVIVVVVFGVIRNLPGFAWLSP